MRSARFAGEDATDEENLAKLLRDAPAGSPLAYVCALVLAVSREADDGAAAAGGAGAGAVILHAVEGRCTGTLDAEPPRRRRVRL